MDVHRGGWIGRGAVCRARSARRRAAHRLRSRRTHQLGHRAARMRGRAPSALRRRFSGCAAPPRRISYSSSWSIRAARTCGGGAGRTSPPRARPRARRCARPTSISPGARRAVASPSASERSRSRSRRVRADRARCGSRSCGSSRAIPRQRDRGSRPSRRRARASGHGPECALDENPRTHWSPDPDGAQSWIQLDLGRSCEFGGVVIDFAGSTGVPPSRLLASDDAVHWKPLAEDRGGPGRRRWLRTSDGEGRFARIEFSPGTTPTVSRVGVVSLELAVSPARYVAATARKERRGLFPRHLLNEQAYWALVGADGDEHKGLLERGRRARSRRGVVLDRALPLDRRTSA